MKKLIFIFLLALTYTINLTTLAEVRFVSKTGSSTPPYTSWITAADSIQKCINICNTGDTVVVANGVYKETLLIETEINLLGSSMDSCVIDGTDLDGEPFLGSTGITIRANNFITIENFHIKGKGVEPLTLVIFALNNGAECKNLMVENANEGIGVSGGNSIIQNCLFKNLSDAIATASDFNVDTFIIRNNHLLNNKIDGVGVKNIGGGIHLISNNILLGIHSYLFSGIDLFSDNYSEVKNNLIANYTSDNYNGGVFLDQAIIENNIFLQNNNDYNNSDNIAVLKGPGTKIKNNIIAYANQFGISSYNDTAFADYNLLWQNGSAANSKVILGENNVFTDPMFVKDTIPSPSSNYDFHLQAFSPAIDTGDPSVLDKDGSRSDIGMFGGMLGEVYSYIDLPPRTPSDIAYNVVSDSQKIRFNWVMNTEADFNYYAIYRDTIQGFIISENNKVFERDTSFFEDTYPLSSSRFYYKITAVDSQSNESLPSQEITVIITDLNEPQVTIANEYILYQNYPNPFNPVTKIGYSLKNDGHVRLVVYDIKGERVRELVNEFKQAGYHEIEFRSEGLSSGIYLYKIEILDNNIIPMYSDLKKLVLLK